ncbi:MAG: hypothetical protein J5772_01415 [Clostridia bacterium]|nr:hypothetical protein [Clostridia bacterium]
MKKLISILLILVLAAAPAAVLSEVAPPLDISHEWASISMGVTHSAAIAEGGLGLAWGYNYNGPIGNGITASSTTTTPYNWGSGIRAVSVGGRTTLSIDNDDVLYLCGEFWFGTGGDSSMPSGGYVYTTPTQFATNVRCASMGSDHLVYVKNDNTLWVYGENGNGQIGDNTTNSCYTAKQILTNVAYAVAGDRLTAAVKTDGTLWVWGNNSDGQVGNNSTTDRKTPVQVLTNVYTVSTMGAHVCAIKNDGSLWAWGDNAYGQLGNGNTTDKKSPVQVMTGAAQVSAGMYHTGVIKTDGSLWFAGNNWRGEFGNGTTSGYSSACSTFTQTEGTYVAVSCGNNTTAVLSVTGQLYVAGTDLYGQLGNGTTGGSFATFEPIDVWIFNAPDGDLLLGDVNCDGTVTFEDVTLLSAYIVGSGTISNQGYRNADMDRNGEVSSVDISWIYNFLLNRN